MEKVGVEHVGVDATGARAWLHTKEEVAVFTEKFAVRVFDDKVAALLIFNVADDKDGMIRGVWAINFGIINNLTFGCKL